MATFSSLDVAIVIVYLAALAGVGIYFSRRQTSLDNFLVARRRMNWLPVGLSLMAALNSGIDYLTQPSATIRFGLVLALGPLSWIALYPWVARVALPFYHRLHFYSVYEYLEARFDVRVRTLAAAIFIVWRLGWMTTALYVPSLAINATTGGRIDLITIVIVLGTLVTIYTMLGGIQAVIWNDVMQFCVMFGGLAATVAIVATSVPGGLAEIWTTAQSAGKTALWVPLVDATDGPLWDNIRAMFVQPVNVPALLLALVIGRMAQYTSDQVMVLRLQTTRTVQDARQAFLVNAAGDVLWMAGLSFVGLALFAYFRHAPPPADLEADRMLPYFMTRAFPAGAVGLVIAAIVAASLSSIDSAIHSCSSVVVIDIYNRLMRGRRTHEAATDQSDRAQVRVSRLTILLMGAAGTTLACNVSGLGGLLEIWNKLTNSFTGPLFGIFLLAMFSRRAGSAAALAGGATGAMTSYYVAYHSGLSFLWPSTFGLAATLLVGGLITTLQPADPDRETLTWRAVMDQSVRSREPGERVASVNE